MSADRFEDGLSALDLDDDFSLRGAAFRRAQDASSSFIFGRSFCSFLDDLGSGGDVNRGTSGASGASGTGGGTSPFHDLLFLLLFFGLSLAAMSVLSTRSSSSSSSVGKLPGSPDFLGDELRYSASSTPVLALDLP